MQIRVCRDWLIRKYLRADLKKKKELDQYFLVRTNFLNKLSYCPSLNNYPASRGLFDLPRSVEDRTDLCSQGTEQCDTARN